MNCHGLTEKKWNMVKDTEQWTMDVFEKDISRKERKKKKEKLMLSLMI